MKSVGTHGDVWSEHLRSEEEGLTEVSCYGREGSAEYERKYLERENEK